MANVLSPSLLPDSTRRAIVSLRNYVDESLEAMSPGGPSSFNYVHTQGVASTLWTISHNLGGYPNVTTMDYAGNEIRGDVDYLDADTITVAFLAATDGTAYLS